MKPITTILTVLAFAASSILAKPFSALHHHHRDIHHEHNLLTRDTNRMVFAHIIVGLTADRSGPGDWDLDMKRAKEAGIDAFALNIGTDSFNDQQLGYAYTSAANNGMKLFISFDFNWWSTGSAQAVGQMAARYGSMAAQLRVDGKVFVSTFVGDGLDTAAVRSAAGVPIYFAPNYRPYVGTNLASVDAAFNWMGWPNNGQNRAPDPGQQNTVDAGDQLYLNALGGKDYVAPVSPWFFTHYGHEVSYSKNWLFPGDTLWYDRWTQMLTMGPRFIEIVSWNDYGESHYVGPLSSPHTDDGASKWINDMPHDGWLEMAKPFIAAYKDGAKSVANYIKSDQIVYWYRPQPKTANCDATDTCMEGPAGGDYYIGRPNGWNMVSDSIFVVALLQSAGTLQVTSGSNTKSFQAAAGANIYTVPMGVGKQSFSLSRGSQTVFSGTSPKDIIDGCVCGLYNFNAFVGTLPVTASPALQALGFKNFAGGLKVSTCAAQPSLSSQAVASTTAAPAASISLTTTTGVTTTTSLTTTIVRPSAPGEWSTTTSMTSRQQSTTKVTTRPLATTARASTTTTTLSRPSASTSSTSSSRSSTTTTTSSSPSSAASTASVCVSGTGSGNYAGLCSFDCHYGYCPPGPCTCTAYGAQVAPPPSTGVRCVPADGLDNSYLGLCSFACDRGYSPPGACKVV